NWIKVVQRVPVRIALDASQLVEHPLRVGLSMDARVDVKNTEGRMLADAARPATATQTRVFDQSRGAAEAEVRRIIAANVGPGTRLAARPPAGSSGASRLGTGAVPRLTTLAASTAAAAAAEVRLK
ncbi:MAG: EmrA/EmrK family multidrug efflux transporter periplasmic adaptor subunit, partial [Burkholderiaceae bacterium]